MHFPEPLERLQGNKQGNLKLSVAPAFFKAQRRNTCSFLGLPRKYRPTRLEYPSVTIHPESCQRPQSTEFSRLGSFRAEPLVALISLISTTRSGTSRFASSYSPYEAPSTTNQLQNDRQSVCIFAVGGKGLNGSLAEKNVALISAFLMSQGS